MVSCLQSIASGLRIVSECVTKTTLNLQFQMLLPSLTSNIGNISFLHLLGLQLESKAASSEILYLFPILHYTAAFLYCIQIKRQCFFLLTKN